MWTIPRTKAEPAGPDLLGLILTDDELGLVMQACSLRTLRVVKAVSRRLRQAGREALCSPCWRAKAANLDELRMHAWVVGGFSCRELAGHKALADVYGVALCGGAIASCSWDGTARLWDASSGWCERTFRPRSPTTLGGGAGPVHCVALAPGALACAEPSGTVHVWGLDGAQEQAPATELHGHLRAVTGLAWAGGGGAGHSSVYRPLLLSGGVDRTLRVWDVAQGRQIACTKEHPRCVGMLRRLPLGSGPNSAPAPPEGAPGWLWAGRRWPRGRELPTTSVPHWAPRHRFGGSSSSPPKPPPTPPPLSRPVRSLAVHEGEGDVASGGEAVAARSNPNLQA